MVDYCDRVLDADGGTNMARLNAELGKELISFLEDKYLQKKGMDLTNLLLESLKKMPGAGQPRQSDDTIALQAVFHFIQ